MVVVKINIICGPLGSGKTSAIVQLLRKRVDDEGSKWAVLVNEFGAHSAPWIILATALQET